MGVRMSDARNGGAVATAGALLVAVAALAGCMAQRTPPSPGQTAKVEPGMGFFYMRNEDEGAKLAYGRANTDEVWLMLQCQPGSRKVDILDTRHSGGRKGEMLILTSGKMQSALPATFQPDEAAGGNVAMAEATPGLPALEGFRRTGAIAVKLGAKEYALSASRGEKAEIARFFSVCEKK